MKIGILTFHCAHNYGAVLQCYALQETLKNMGHEVEVINYRPQYLIEPYKRFSIKWFMHKNIFKSIKRLILEISIFRKRNKRYKNFEYFIQNKLNLSSPINNTQNLGNYDIYIVGSDQIWNKNLTRGIDAIYWGNFKRPSHSKLISYAASMETTNISNDTKQIITHFLNNFDTISVREQKLQNLLQEFTPKKIVTVLDPTLMADKKIWDKIIINPLEKKKYILVYQFTRNENVLRIARSIAKEINAEVLDINVDVLNKNKNLSLFDISPGQFLGYFKNSCFVVTSTFHGTAFSIIFNKPFYCLKIGNNENTRVQSLLNALNLNNRFLPENSSPHFKDINYLEANLKLTELKLSSKEYLSSNCIIHNS